MTNRRHFLKIAGLAGAGTLLHACAPAADPKKDNAKPAPEPYRGGLAISTWDAGIAANEGAFRALEAGGKAVDMAEAGVMITEADRSNLSVGLSGLPDREGRTTLDACIMDHVGRAGSVCFLEGIDHPVQVARLVMEKTPHVMLVGEGAQLFAISEGIPLSTYINPEAQKAWQEWMKTSEYKPVINIENHDTIGLIAMDRDGDLAGSCTTSGLAYKMRGRVGDSPIIGSGLYVDNEVGAATGTGLGETVLRSCSAFLIVELMRQGAHPQEACEEAIRRVMKINRFMTEEFQVGLLAVNKAGETGAYAIRPGFTYALKKDGKNEVYKATSEITG